MAPTTTAPEPNTTAADEARRLRNQMNARSSTGPRTSFGREASLRNLDRTRHGMTAAVKVLPGEPADLFDRIWDALAAAHQPVTEAEYLELEHAVRASIK